MSDFMNFVFAYLGRAIPVAVLALAAAALVLRHAVKRHKRRHGDDAPFPWAKAVLAMMLVGYLAAVMFVTVGRGSYYTGNSNFHLFRAWREAWNNFSERNWLNVLLNIGMFVPMGILLPLIWNQLRKWYRMLPAGLLTTLLIESMQWLKGAGLFDVDDLFCNTLGTMIGFWLVMAVFCVRTKRPGKCALHCACLLAVAAAIGGIFAAYRHQEFGNLALAPAFRVNTAKVEWTISCELSDEEQAVSIYRTDPPGRADCENFGRAFLESRGVAETDVTYYNEEVYLREHLGNRIIEVWYLDGSYDYWNLDTEPEDQIITDEQTIRSALEEFGITVPETAEFYVNAQMDHCFAVERYNDGDTMIDGTLRCGYYEGTGIGSIENNLISFTYYGEGDIISPRAAVEQIQSGWISGGDWFERVSPETVKILSCELTFQVDTKGFYQPVYEIELSSEDGAYQTTALIPALR